MNLLNFSQVTKPRVVQGFSIEYLISRILDQATYISPDLEKDFPGTIEHRRFPLMPIDINRAENPRVFSFSILCQNVSRERYMLSSRVDNRNEVEFPKGSPEEELYKKLDELKNKYPEEFFAALTKYVQLVVGDEFDFNQEREKEKAAKWLEDNFNRMLRRNTGRFYHNITSIGSRYNEYKEYLLPMLFTDAIKEGKSQTSWTTSCNNFIENVIRGTTTNYFRFESLLIGLAESLLQLLEPTIGETEEFQEIKHMVLGTSFGATSLGGFPDYIINLVDEANGDSFGFTCSFELLPNKVVFSRRLKVYSCYIGDAPRLIKGFFIPGLQEDLLEDVRTEKLSLESYLPKANKEGSE